MVLGPKTQRIEAISEAEHSCEGDYAHIYWQKSSATQYKLTQNAVEHNDVLDLIAFNSRLDDAIQHY